ncbi:MAG: hypothetical protein ACHQ03_07850 [Candidatus Bathyarchaeia archaeon]
MDGSTIIGVGGLVVALVTTAMAYVWSYKTRAYPHREFLYQRQIDEYKELSVCLSRNIDVCEHFLVGKTTLTPEMRAEFLEILNKTADALHEQLWKSSAILPKDVLLAVNALLIKLVTEIPQLENARQIGVTLLHAETAVYNAMRTKAGVAPLTKEMLAAFGQG